MRRWCAEGDGVFVELPGVGPPPLGGTPPLLARTRANVARALVGCVGSEGPSRRRLASVGRLSLRAPFSIRSAGRNGRLGLTIGPRFSKGDLWRGASFDDARCRLRASAFCRPS
ncbi:hypothetical protein CONPUDRAFT_140621 [Coniophora puteana RWD-64-598 SS2]|uniref:Uncharacterized protein n=1 Tax=Coniophora puteana (strain RWD-64-598) TaxID=741705 RepID=R7SG79_CONPW|nr:uncharacterized protein CONPUDRAFT_140621 [Coniophora puteana RWD-64-598 SS2]EIW74094.1 hypothetical protein CONPUDRAFT_140621 [Coniophora puteana RWD-64-598 SS2]